MSDLQCPATFLLVPADAQPAALERALGLERAAEVRSTPHPDASGLARHLATAWGLPEPSACDLDAASYRAVLADLADLRRGENVVIVVDPALLRLVLADDRGGRADLAAVEVDADGWTVRGRRLVYDRLEVRDPATG